MGKRKISLIILSCILMSLPGCMEQGDKEALEEMSSIFLSKENKKDENTNPGETMEIHYIDVGQGDSTLIKTGEHAMLIDAGENNQGKEVVSYLENLGVDKLDYVIGTHPDSDHIGGLDVVLYEMDCETLIMPPVESDTKTYHDVVQAVKTKELDVTSPKVGKNYSFGEGDFTIIAPNEDYGDNTNNWSVGIMLDRKSVV